MMQCFCKQFAQKRFIIDVWQGSKHATDNSQKIAVAEAYRRIRIYTEKTSFLGKRSYLKLNIQILKMITLLRA